MLKKLILSSLVTVAFFCGAMVQDAPDAEATVYEWDIFDHTGSGTPNVYFGDSKATREGFALLGGTMRFNETTGIFNFSGDAFHAGSGEKWKFSGNSIGLRFMPGNGFPAPGKTVPYNGMIQDMINAGRDAYLIWDDFVASITTDILNPAFTQDPHVFGKGDGLGNPAYFRWDKWGWGQDFFGLSAWYANSADEYIYDYHWTFHNARVIPEPSTVALIGLGLVGLVGSRRFKKRKQN